MIFELPSFSLVLHINWIKIHDTCYCIQCYFIQPRPWTVQWFLHFSFLCSTKKLCVVTIESDISLSVRNMSCFDLWLTFGSILAQTLFISPPTHTYARTDTVPPNPLSYPPYSAQSPFIWLFNSFGVDSSYPKIHRFLEENMWSIWRRIHRTPSKVLPRTAFEKLCRTTQPTQKKRERKKCAALRSAPEQALLICDWMGDCFVRKSR